MKKALTLVEVSIVISILGILAGIAIVTINPREQTGKTRDSIKKNDAMALLSSLDRYYASYRGKYPWNSVSDCSTPSDDGTSIVKSCWLDRLVEVGELQSSFASSKNLNSFFVTLDSSSNVHICFVPESNAFLNQAVHNSRGGSADPGTHICVPE